MSDLAADGFQASPFFKELHDGLADNKIKQKAIAGVKAVIVITLKNKEGKDQSWILDLKNDGTVKKIDGSLPKSDVQLLLKDVDFVKLANGKANGQKLFMNGKLKVKGNMMKATAIESVFKQIDPRPKL
ncbi:sterol-binding protein [Hyphopichia burtonii NRRL Y-1933]|uniref:Oleate-induced peroxisomal protein POX18 n=1 Tax=Hyphopichia burtonii NRRL Y-1933 TaxID=984485 RepID=A0A1E4RI99_9ASCO|nr:sterol-binding protein [Hyphopichia burtonii NRRL Y-1933]ODV66989.1 sterol-binding protein [Hyphopichia burtonii NRRL Y-1933]